MGHLSNFVVFTTQRNGSTWLMSLLNALENVSAHGELFLPRPRSPERRWDSGFAYPRYVESKARYGRLRPFSVFEYLDALYGSPGSIGFKLMYSQLKSFPEILPYLMRKNIPVIHLVRRNHLDVLISFAIKRQIGKAHILADEARPANMRVYIPPESLLRDLRRLQIKHDLGRRVLRLSRLPHIEVGYEELVNGTSRFADVVDFLRIPQGAEPPQSNILKTRLSAQAQVITNYDEVRKVLEHSHFAGLLD